jgi:hypothetical protein
MESMSNPEGILTGLVDDQFFTKIDLSKGYWQLPVEEKSRYLIAFTTPHSQDAVRHAELRSDLQLHDEDAASGL